jgi:hypothetical protein
VEGGGVRGVVVGVAVGGRGRCVTEKISGVVGEGNRTREALQLIATE